MNKISTLTSRMGLKKGKFQNFSVLNLEIWNSNVMKSSRRSQWIENKSREYLEIPIFHKKDDRKGLNTLFVKISTLTSQKRQISEFSVLNLEIWNSNVMKSWRRSQWIENKSREYLEIPNISQKRRS